MRRKYRKKLKPIRNDETGTDIRVSRYIEEERRKIRLEYPGLAVICSYLKPVPVSDVLKNRLDTDGRHIFYNPKEQLSLLEKGSDVANPKLYENMYRRSLRDAILHIIFHGLSGHFSDRVQKEDVKASWMAKDGKVLFLEQLCEVFSEDPLYSSAEDSFEKNVVFEEGFYISEEKLYQLVKYSRKVRYHMERLLKHFYIRDDHSTWALPEAPKPKKERQDDWDGPAGEEVDVSKAEQKVIAEFWVSQMKALGISMGDKNSSGEVPDKDEISALAIRLKVGGSDRNYGHRSGSGSMTVTADRNEPLDYKGIIEDLGRIAETPKEEDSIDPALYSLGMEMYGDMPIVEPLEISEKKKLNTIVIAIDTSGSCEDEAPKFLGETIEILKEIERSADIESIVLLTCDAEIQSEQCGASIEELCLDTDTMDMSGFGGTSFVPVFERIAELEAKGTKTDALIYYSDGWGSFPEEEPGYPVYFVLPENDWDDEEDDDDYMPDWVKVRRLKK